MLDWGERENGGTWLYFDGPRSCYSTSKYHGRRAIGIDGLYLDHGHY
jgi:hypothetical protein